MRSLAVLVVLALATPALAQAPGETAPQPLSSPAGPAEEKDPDVAMLLSFAIPTAGLFTTIAGAKGGSGAAALVGVGAMFVGPSVGRWYAGSPGAGSLALRGAAGVSMLAGVVLIIGSEDCEGSCNDHGDTGAALLFGGLGLWAGTTIYDVIMAGRDAKDWNRSHAAQGYALRLKPTMISVAGHHAMGLALGGHF